MELTRALDAFEADDGIGCMVITGSEKAFAAGADIKAMKEMSYMDVYKADFITAEWERVTRCRKPVIAGRGRLRAGRRVRTRHDVRFHHRSRQREIRPAEINLGINPRGRRHAAAAALRGQVEGDGDGAAWARRG